MLYDLVIGNSYRYCNDSCCSLLRSDRSRCRIDCNDTFGVCPLLLYAKIRGGSTQLVQLVHGFNRDNSGNDLQLAVGVVGQIRVCIHPEYPDLHDIGDFIIFSFFPQFCNAFCEGFFA